MYYFGARYYDPRTSVWQSADPILGKYLPTGSNESKLPGGGGVFNSPNLGVYTYTHQNPVNLIDPDGREALYNVSRDLAEMRGADMTAFDASRKRLGKVVLGTVAVVAVTVYSAGVLGPEATAVLMAAATGEAGLSSTTKRVGRHMNQNELAKMRKTERVQEGGGGQTRVADPANQYTYKNPPKEDVYVEFDVPAERVLPHSEGTGRIPGPNSPDARVPGRNPADFEMPPATNIEVYD